MLAKLAHCKNYGKGATKMLKSAQEGDGKYNTGGAMGPEHDAAVTDVNNFLAHTVRLAHPKANSQLCMFTDAFNSHWSAALTQSQVIQLQHDVSEQEHEPLAFLLAAFSGQSERWSMNEKEAYTLMESMAMLDFITATKEVHTLTDHANLHFSIQSARILESKDM